MNLLLITYELKAPGRDYTKLYNAIKSAKKGWWHYLGSTWIVASTNNAEAWANRLRKLIDANDRLLVVDITGCDKQGWLPQKAWAWLAQQDPD